MRGYRQGYIDALKNEPKNSPYSYDMPYSRLNYNQGYYLGKQRRIKNGITLKEDDSMIPPIQATNTRMKMPRRQHAMLKLDHRKYSIIAEKDGEIAVPDLETAFRLIHEIKTGSLYDEVA